MKSMWIALSLTSRSRRRRGTGSPGRARCGWRRSRRAACRRRRCRAGRCGPRRRRARPRRAARRPRRGDDRAQDVLGGVRVDLDGAAALEADAQVAHDRAGDQHERLGRGHVAVGALRIRGREDLLGREVGHVLDSVDGLEAGGLPGRAGQQPDRQVRARTLVVQGVETASVSSAAADERVGSLAPGGDRVVLVEPQHVDDLLAQPVERLLAGQVRGARARPTRAWGRAGSSSWSCAR